MEAVREIYSRFLPLIVFEQQPGLAIRKEIYRMRGLIKSNRVRHPGATIDKATTEQLQHLIDSVLPGVNLTEPIPV
jgi:4-hydroxy-tetrahydrodipicolinate synthase